MRHILSIILLASGVLTAAALAQSGAPTSPQSSTDPQSTGGTQNASGSTSSGAQSSGTQGSSGSGGGSASRGTDTTRGVDGRAGNSGSAGTTGAGGPTGSSASAAAGQSTGVGQTGAGGTGATGAAGATGTAGATGAAGGSMKRADQTMLKSMAQAQINEIAAARQALDISKNDSVRKFAQTMIDDHSKALADITTLARSRNVTLPTEPDRTHKAAAALMQKMSGDTFDKAYIRQAGVSDHTKVHSMLQKNASTASDPELKTLAATLTPTVAAHLDAAKTLQNAAGTAAR